MLAQLKSDTEKNVDSMRALSKAGAELPLRVFDNGDSFGVVRQTYLGEKGVRFTLRRGEIRVESNQGIDVNFVATLTLSDEGECRLLVDGKQLDRWQVLRRALEPLFFPVDE